MQITSCPFPIRNWQLLLYIPLVFRPQLARLSIFPWPWSSHSLHIPRPCIPAFFAALESTHSPLILTSWLLHCSHASSAWKALLRDLAWLPPTLPSGLGPSRGPPWPLHAYSPPNFSTNTLCVFFIAFTALFIYLFILHLPHYSVSSMRPFSPLHFGIAKNQTGIWYIKDLQ